MVKEILNTNVNIDRSKYIVLYNKQQKKWILPKKNLKLALEIYQPSSLIGNIMKKTLPCIINLSYIRKALKIKEIELGIDTDFYNYLNNIFGKDISLSFFLGTPSIHQKTTIQISKDNEILGYCKVTKDTNILELFYKEIKLLKELEKIEISNVPKYLGKYEDKGIYSFCQSTKKTPKSNSAHLLNDYHFRFLQELFQKTKKEIKFVDSSYAKMLEKLKKNIKNLDVKDKTLIQKVINFVENKNKNKNIEFGIYHGDFTPWNMFIENGDLFVFDFEYFKNFYPPYLDSYHFFSQVKIHVEKKKSDEIYNEYIRAKEQFNKYVEDSDFCYLQYLLEIINVYLGRNKGKLNDIEQKNIEIWIGLIKKLYKY